MITLRATIVVVAQKPPPKLELNKTPPADYSTEMAIACGVCGLIVFISCIVLNMCCGGSLNSLSCFKTKSKPLTDIEMQKIKEKVDKEAKKKVEE